MSTHSRITRAALVAAALSIAPSIFAATPSNGAAKTPNAGAKTTSAKATPIVAILCYHDLSDELGSNLQTVSPRFLRDQIRSCKKGGWTFLSLSELLANRAHPELLPPRVMVLTFDDGYRSFYDKALPILREEGVKATLGIVSSFTEKPPADLPALMTWQQIREIDRGGWVEIASHSHDLHRYEVTNPYRDTGPAASTRRYLLNEARYETREEYRSRLRTDLAESQRILQDKLGHTVSTLVWPYGNHNDVARALAAEAGLKTSLALGWREVRPEDFATGCLPRILVTRNLHITGGGLSWLRAADGVMRAARVRLDDLWSADGTVMNKRIDQMIKRLQAIGASHVLLDACADPKGNGELREAWFMNHQTFVRADVWSMAAAKFDHARLKVWMRAPSMNLTWAWDRHPECRLTSAAPAPETAAPMSGSTATSGSSTATSATDAKTATKSRGRSSAATLAERSARLATRWPTRLSPELSDARRAAIDFYTDLAVYCPVEGIVFDDDAVVLTDEHLVSDADADLGARSTAVRGLLHEIETTVRSWRPECQFGRVIGADAVMGSSGPSPATAQDFRALLRDRQLVILSASADDPDYSSNPTRWVQSVSRRAMEQWRREVRSTKSVTPFASTAPPLLIELPVGEPASTSIMTKNRLSLLLGEARRTGILSFGVGPVTPANQDGIETRALEAMASAPSAATDR